MADSGAGSTPHVTANRTGPGRPRCSTWSYLWAAPNTLLGLSVGMLTLATGGRRQWRGGVVEFYGGAATWLLRWLAADAGAMTLGHCILGQTPAILDAARSHEWVHVEQAERWGPAFLPAYLGCSAWLWCRGRRPYWDNPFEVEAYRRTD